MDNCENDHKTWDHSKTTERGQLLNVDGVAQVAEAARGCYQGLVLRPGYWRSKNCLTKVSKNSLTKVSKNKNWSLKNRTFQYLNNIIHSGV